MSQPITQLSPELPRDPRITVLELPNGLRTWVWRQPDPAGWIAAALSVAAGSLCEAPHERGLAHLLEHLAFRGGDNLPAGELARLFERTGTRLGRHHNAATGLDRTTYSLSLPGHDEATLELVVAGLSDFARGLTLADEAVVSERRVVLEEARARRSAGRRLRERMLELLLPDSVLAAFHPLGDPAVVAGATADQLRRFYQSWYRPDTSTLVVVGEVEPETVESIVRRRLGDWRAAGPRPVVPTHDLGDPARTATYLVHQPEATAEARLATIRRLPGARTVDDLKRQLARDGALWLLGRRLDELVTAAGSRVRGARLVRSALLGPWSVVEAVAEAAPGDLAAALTTLTAEVARVERYGFTTDEADLFARSLELGARRAVRRDARRGAAACLPDLLDAIAADLPPPPSPEQRLALVAALGPHLAGDELGVALTGVLPADAVGLLVVSGDGAEPLPEPERAPAERVAAAAGVRPPSPRRRRTRLLNDPPAAGAIVGRRVEEASAVTSLELESGVVVHLKPLPSSPDRAIVQATWVGGRIEETAATAGLTAAAALALASPATLGLPSLDIRDALAGSSLAASCAVNEDCVSLTLSSDPEELEIALDLLSLLLGEPTVEDGALARWRDAVSRDRRPRLEELLALAALDLLTGGDRRFAPLTPERAAAIERGAAQRWLEEVLGEAPVEVAVVSPASAEVLAETATRHLAGLRRRPADKPHLEDLRQLAAPEGEVAAELAAPAGDRAALLVGWRATPYGDGEARALLHMAVQLLDRRLHHELREARGLTYDPDCSFSPSRGYPTASLLSATFYAPPARADEAVEAAREVFERLAEDGPSEAEMDSVRRQFAALAAAAEREPRFWARNLAEARYRGLELGALADLPGRCRRRTAEQLQKALAACVRPERRLTVVGRPG